MNELKDFQELKSLEEEVKQKRAEITGQIKASTESLKDLGLTISTATEEIDKLDKQIEKITKEIKLKSSTFKKQYESRLRKYSE